MNKGFQIALERIEGAKKSIGDYLDLGVLGLTELPPEISELKNLKHLHLYGNRLKEILPISELTNLTNLTFWDNEVVDLSPICSLKNLKYLDFSENEVSDLTPLCSLEELTDINFENNLVTDLSSIGGLKNLKNLNFSQNKVSNLQNLNTLKELEILFFTENNVEDLSPLNEMKKLKELNFSFNQVRSLFPIRSLNKLSKLDFSRNKVHDLGPIHDLTNLIILNFWGNTVRDLSPLSKLKKLKVLDFYENHVKDLSPILGLKNLTRFDIAKNKISYFPQSLLKLKLPVFWPEEHGMYEEVLVVNGNPFTEPPTEIVRQGNKAIANYYKKPRERLGELKIILVGEGTSGKTSVLKRLLDNDFDPNEDQTHGIRIRKEDLTSLGLNTTGRFWDFGGQEIMHATHKFFLSERSVYVLVLNARKDENPDYWLRHIETYGGGTSASVLILFNKCDENPSFDLDRKVLKEKYPFIKGFFPVSAKTGVGIEDFKRALFEQISDHPLAESKFPTKWIAIKNALEKAESNFIGYDVFRKICSKNGVKKEEDQDFLLTALNDLGVALHFENLRGFNTQVLNPLWLTNAVYRVVNSPILTTDLGILECSKLGQMLSDPRYGSEKFEFPKEKWQFIVRIMQEFELCFETEREKKYIVPERLPAAGENNVPLVLKTGHRLLKLSVKFPEFMPTSIFPRLMVRMNHLIRGEMRWRTAMQLEENDYFEAQARVTADRDDRSISIEVSGKNPRGFLSMIRKELESIRKSFTGLKMEEFVPIEQEFIDYLDLVGYEDARESYFYFPKLRKKLVVSELLDGIEEKEMRSEEAQMPVSAFISYAHADAEAYNALKLFKNNVHAQVRLGNVEMWDDGAILAGENWSNAIWQKFERAELIICLISPNFISSDFCYERELKKAFEAHEKGEKIIFPVRLIDCDYSELPIGGIQGAPSEWLNPGQKDEPKHELWAEMSRKFGELIKVMKQRKLTEKAKRERGGKDN
jgi:internalin A